MAEKEPQINTKLKAYDQGIAQQANNIACYAMV